MRGYQNWMLLSFVSIVVYSTHGALGKQSRFSESRCLGVLSTRVPEGRPPGTPIFKFTRRPNIVYTFHRDLFSSPARAIFQISPDGLVSNRVTLDREDPRGSKFMLTVLTKEMSLQDNGKTSRTRLKACSLRIDIEDINDNDPAFGKDLYVGTVEENAAKGSFVRGLQGIYAVDADLGNYSVDSYRILPGNGDDKFEAVTENIGGLKFLSIRTLTPLDREDVSFYVLTVEAVDGVRSRKRAITQIRINVLDVNDCSPTFESSEYAISVLSSAPVATSILKVHAQDEDLGANGDVYYFFKTKIPNFFTLDPHTGVIRVARVLDSAESLLWFNFEVIAQDRGHSQRQASTVVKVKLVKSNRALSSAKSSSDLRFAKRSYVVRVREDLPLNCHILHAGVKHLTRSTFRPVFSVLSARDIPFQVDVNSGVLYLTKRLDHEKIQVYDFKLGLAINPSQAKLDEVNVRIEVDDVNENLHGPVFEQANLEMNLERNSKSSQPVHEFRASDKDEDANGLVKYFIRGGNGARMLTIDEDLGKLCSKPKMNWQGVHKLELLVEARDGGRQWKSAMQFAIVNVVGPQGCSPVFARPVYDVFLRENQPPGMFAVVADAQDCEGNRVMYSITAGNSEGRFEIDEGTGIVRTRKMLDREHKHEYFLNITAKSQMSSIAQVFVRVEDVNDNAPVFDSPYYQVYITENRGRVNNLLCLVARDKDSGENGKVGYEIVAGNDKNLFAVDTNTGTLSSDSLTFEDKKEHRLVIRATDHGRNPRSSNTTVKVIVTDINDPPKFMKDEITVSISEEKPRQSTIVVLSVSDEDDGENGEFMCTYENIDAEEFGKFEVKTTGDGCEVRNLDILDWFDKKVYSLRVRVTDRAPAKFQKSDTITVKIKIEDINNHAPEFSQISYWASVPDDTPLSTSTVLAVKAKDKDDGANAEVRYSISNHSTNPIFTIDPKDGSLAASSQLQKGRKYQVVVMATDSGEPQRRQSVTCFVTVYPRGMEFPPRVSGVKNQRISEHTTVQTVVTKVRLHGKGNKVVKFHIVGGNIGEAFRISPTGKVRVARRLDYETVQEYNLIVRVVYRHQQIRRKLVIEVPLKIEVQDENDNKPSFLINSDPLVIDVNKKLKAGLFITQVSAFDADSGANGLVKYSIKRGLDPVYFYIVPNSGIIKASKSLDTRDAPYTFTVVAEDDGTPRKRAECEVQVRVHKSSKRLKLETDKRDGSVDEGPLGIYTKAMTFKVNYGGENDVTYSIVGGNSDDSFCVDVRGSLYSIRELDREMQTNYILKLSANDGESSAFFDVNITVEDVNDNPPRFGSDPIRVFTKDNDQVQRIGTVKAEDADSGENATVRYKIVGTSSELSDKIFNIDPGDGTLIITSALNHEEAPEHELTIAATDQGSPSYRTFGRVIITVEDDNDNSPRFLSSGFAESVPFNAPLGYPVLQASATDDDSGLNGEIRYKIESKSTMFTIDESTGWIRVASRLSLGTISFLISATDGGTPERNHTARVNITVTAGEGPPRFFHVFPRGLHANVEENQDIGTEVLKVEAMSRDLVTYHIDDASIDDFEIDAISGRITIAQTLDFERKQSYDFTVSATDRSDRRGEAHVTITIINVNDNKPRILTENDRKEIACRIHRQARVGTLLTQIRAHDDDKNDQLHFFLTNQSHFSIDSTGKIKTKASLVDINYDLIIGVTVKDNWNPPLEDTIVIRVVLLNYDFTQRYVTAMVSEATPPGKTLSLSGKIYPPNRSAKFSIVYPLDCPFSVQETNGNLVLKKPLDFEQQKEYSLTVRIAKTGPNNYVDVEVKIDIKDENDNYPEFDTTGTPPGYVPIHKNARPRTLIHHFKATDKDSGSNGEVEFRMGNEYQRLFQLGRKTGDLETTGVTLARKSYNVTVEAYDKGIPSLVTQTFIIVNVDYIKPRFTKEEYQFEIKEDAATGHRVGVIEARSFGVLLTYKIMATDSKFSINPKTGALTLLQMVDYENSQQRVFELVVLAEAQETSRTRVNIRVKDVNDCAPKFYRRWYVDHVPESAPMGTTILRVHATDDDSEENAEIRYSLDNEDFIIDSYTGVVTTAVKLDYETKRVYKITVMAIDRGVPRLNGTASLTVHITNVNDNVPVFTLEEYSCSLWENAREGSLVTTVRAIDADSDWVNYDITAGNDASTFVINPATGVIKVSNVSPVTIVGPSYHLNVTASDGVHKGQAVVRVIIKDINDHAPVFPECARYSPTVPENSPSGTSVLKVRASDEDLGRNGEVEYAIVHPKTSFQIDRKTGLIQTTAMFDRESQRTYSIRVKAIDGSGDMKPEERREGSCLFMVTVTDRNDNEPVFAMNNYEADIKEDVAIGHFVIQVKADDSDEGSNGIVRYVFHSPTPLFAIDSQTGVVTTQANLMKKKQEYKLKITATDGGKPQQQSDAYLTVHVIDSKNDPPEFKQNYYEVQVPEDVSSNSKVATVVATSKHEVYYEIIPGNVPATNSRRDFDIDPTDGVVRVQGRLDRETTPDFSLIIQAENDASPALKSRTTLRVIVTDVNDCRPEFVLPKYDGRIPENSDRGTSVLTVQAKDRDNSPYNKTVYSIWQKNKFFSIDHQTGVIRSKVKFDREKMSNYRLFVKATDQNDPKLWRRVTVRVRVTDENDMSPKFSPRTYSAKIHENVENGTVVTTVTASDDDLGLNAKVRFDIVSGNEHDKFRIDSDNGRVEVNGNMDYEEESEYELNISASDGKHKDFAKLTITVENENDNKPIFRAKNGIQLIQECEVLENSPGDTMVTNLTATDLDSDENKFTKKIVYSLSNQVKNIFQIDPYTGLIRTKVQLDREKIDTYKFQAYAIDGYGMSGSVEVVVHVTDVNDNAPQFQTARHLGFVYENMPPGAYVKTVEARDEDDKHQGGNGVVTYRLHSDPYNVFVIEPATGILRTRIRLDRENKSSYTLIVNATDGGKPPLSSETVVAVNVLDVNDNAPKFINNTFKETIPEDRALGSTVLRLTATDADINNNAKLTFSMSKNTGVSGFSVRSDTGDVVIASRLNYEERTRHEFEVEVKDKGNPPKSDKAKVVIRLQDSNDKAPYFIRSHYTRTLAEGDYKDTRLFKLQAKDDDATMPNRVLYYNISDGDPKHSFWIDRETGEMSVISSLDYEETALHALTVRATNTAPPYLYGETSVTVSVTDVNDNPPELTHSSVIQRLFENSPRGYRVIGRLHATDRDMDPNGKPFTFGISEDNGREKDIFQLNRETGELTTNATFDRERQAVYYLRVWVRDSGDPPLNKTTTVMIQVRDRNDNQHEEGILELTVNLMAQQSLSPDTSLGRVFVDDRDTDDERFYDMLTGDFNIFEVNRYTGNISMKQRPIPGKYTFRVKVSDRNSSFDPVDCKVKIKVNEIPTEAFFKSISLRLLGSRRKEIIRRLPKYKKAIAKAVNTRPENIDVFSIQNAGEDQVAVDIRFAAHGSPYYDPERLIASLKTNRTRLPQNWEVVIGYDACAKEPCEDGACRSEVIMTGDIETIDDGFGKAFTSVMTKTEVKCGKCDELYRPRTTCDSRLCSNGTCADTPIAFTPTIPKQYGRSDCRLSTRSFKRGDWIWLRPLRSCRVANLSLEFSTLKENGVLLYNGPVAVSEVDENYDFIAVQLIRGKVHVKLSLGGRHATNLVVAKSNKLNDGKWHLVDIYRNATLVRVTIDKCRSSLVKTSPTKDTEDRSNCEITQVIRNTKFNLLNVNDPLQIGGTSSKPPSYTGVEMKGYDGCIRNLKENGKMFDLRVVSNSKGSQEGCPAMDKHCQPKSPCHGAAKCIPARNNFSCVCPPGYEGRLCDIESLDHTFNPPSYVKYQLRGAFLQTYNPKFTKIDMMVRTRDKDGGILMAVREKGQERLLLRLKGGGKKLSLVARINRGDEKQLVQLKNAFPEDGQWHHVFFDRDRNGVHLGIDPSTGPIEISGRSKASFITLNIVEDSEIFVGGLPSQSRSKDNLDGCIKDIRINGKSFPHNGSNDIAVARKPHGDVSQGCTSNACKKAKCPQPQFCHDLWRKHQCFYRPCNAHPCKNGASCIDQVVSGVVKFKCECRPGFNGTRCASGADVIMKTGDVERINLKLVIGLSCFVFVLVSATVLIICYHRYQTNGKATFVPKMNQGRDHQDGIQGNKKGLMVMDKLTSNGTPKPTNLITSYPSMYSTKPLSHTCESGKRPSVPPRIDSLQADRAASSMDIPPGDIPPMIDVVLSEDSDSSTTYEGDYTEYTDKEPTETCFGIANNQPYYVPPEYTEDEPSWDIGDHDRYYTSQENSEDESTSPKMSAVFTRGFKVPTVTWNDIEELGRKFYRGIVGKEDDTRSNSRGSTTSNSSSIVTVVANPTA